MSETAIVRATPKRPVEFLLNLLVTLLTPLFLAATGDDLSLARFAAAQTLESYRAETHSDLITVAKIIAFGLAAIGSLSLSMAEDLPIPLVLRLRASANASDRAEHRNRLALAQAARPEHQTPLRNPEPAIDEAALAAAVAETQQRTARNLARFKSPTTDPSTPAPTASTPVPSSPVPSSPVPSSPAPSTPVPSSPAPPAPTASTPVASAPAPSAPVASAPTRPATPVTDRDQHYQATWAACAAEIAAETAASLPNLPPNERKSAATWVEALNDAANSFLTDGIPPRPRPGDLAHIIRGI